MPSTRRTPATFALLGLAFIPFVSAGQTIYGYSGNRIRGSLSDNTTTQFSTSGWRIGCNSTADADCPREQQLTMVSRTAGSTFTLPFTGTGVQVNGSVVVGAAGTTQTLSAGTVSDYLSLTLDAVPYSPAGLTGNDYNQVLFNSTTIADGSHTLVLTIKGGATVGIRYVTVNSLDIVPSSALPSQTAATVDSTSSAAPTSIAAPQSTGTPLSDGDMAAFVATGVMAVILLIVGIILYIRKRKAAKNAPPSDKGKEMVDMKEKDGDAYSDDGSTRRLNTLANSKGGKSSPKWEGSTRHGSGSSSMYKEKAITKPSLATLTPTPSQGRRDDDQVWDKVGNWRERSATPPERDYPKVNGGVGENLHNWRQRTGADKYESGTTDTSLPSVVDSDRERARRERAREEKEREWRRLDQPNSPLSPAVSEQLPAYRSAATPEDRRPREREVMERKDSNTDSSWARERLARREREEMTSPVNRPRPERGDSRSNRNGRPNSREAPVFTGRGNDQGRLMVQHSDRDGRHRSDTSMLQQVSRSEAW